MHNLIYVRSMFFTLRCQINVPHPAYYFWEIGAPSPLLAIYLDLQPRLLISKILKVLYKKITFITQFHIAILLQILCVFQNTSEL